jgi:hypothetical protein
LGKSQLEEMKLNDPDRYAIMSVDPYKPYAVSKNDHIPQKEIKVKKAKKSKKIKKEKKKKSWKNVLFENEFVKVEYECERISASKDVLVTFTILEHETIKDFKLSDSLSSIFFHSDHWSMLVPLFKIAVNIPLKITYSTTILHEHLINLNLPIIAKMEIKNETVTRMSSMEFLDLVQTGGFTHQRQQSIKISSDVDFNEVCIVLKRLKMRQVEVHDDCAVTLLGYCDGPVVGLVKYSSGNVYVDFKGPDLVILEGLASYLEILFTDL